MTSDEIQTQLAEIETRLDRLRALYEQYFVGIERLEPQVQKKDVERRFQTLRKIQIRNTALRFRFQVLVQRYTSYLTYWQRICRQIEEGTFKRDLVRLQRYGRSQNRPHGSDDDDEAIEEIDTAFEGFGTLRPPPGMTDTPVPTPAMADGIPAPREVSPSPPPIPPAAVTAAASKAGTALPPAMAGASLPQPQLRLPPPPPQSLTSAPKSSPPRRTSLSPFGAPRPESSTPTLRTPNPSIPKPPAMPPVALQRSTEAAISAARNPAPADDLRALYERYRDARLRNGEAEVSFEALERQVDALVPRLKQQYGDGRFTLDIVVKNGRTILRPVVRSK
jgi:hypothetical protein